VTNELEERRLEGVVNCARVAEYGSAGSKDKWAVPVNQLCKRFLVPIFDESPQTFSIRNARRRIGDLSGEGRKIRRHWRLQLGWIPQYQSPPIAAVAREVFKYWL
jgi:hypothetical protein